MSQDVQVTTLDILRHGECADGEVFRGRIDSALSERGQQQMQRAIDTGDNHWDTIVTSPLQRCRVFSQSLASDSNRVLIIEADFQEMSFGDWDGLTTEQVENQDADKISAYWLDRENNTPPNGEPLIDFHQRTGEALQRLLENEQGRHILLVTHGGVLRSLIAHCLKMPLKSLAHIEVPYACRTQIRVFHSPNHPDWMQLMHHNQPQR
ncbi:MAG: histidine phosphatase family protein [Cellvibrionaceae bacterium]